MTQPTIGRGVHYVSFGTPGGEYSSKCRAAIVTEVPSTPVSGVDDVSLAVLNPTGLFFDLSVPQAEETPYRGGTWHWPCVRTVPEEEH